MPINWRVTQHKIDYQFTILLIIKPKMDIEEEFVTNAYSLINEYGLNVERYNWECGNEVFILS